jgi:amino acid adenylation domain-containing protein
LLEQFSEAAERPLAQISLLDAQERDRVLRQWNETSRAFPQQCIHEAFEAQVEQHAAAIAVRCGSEAVTYAELNARANQLAHHLRSRGVGPEVRVAICVERSIDMIVGLLGILKAGGAYVPLEPSYPSERISFVLADCQAPILLTQQRLRDRLSAVSVETIYLDGPLMPASVENPVLLTSAENSAHVIYTSGSTGQPKGVVGTHRASMNRFAWMWRTYPFAADEVCCQKTSLSFVDAVWEIFGPLLKGVPLVIIPDEAVKDPREFLEALSVNEVTRLVLVPSLLRVMLEMSADLSRKLGCLRYCVCSGETLPVELASKFRQQLPHTNLINLYGSSEVAADVTCYEVSVTDNLTTIPIGRPIDNTEVYILDLDFQPCAVGIIGEICVSGEGLARGYLNRADLTAERFVPHPFTTRAGARLFRTGDVGRYLPDGTIEYRGRLDHQVKVRGFRIELGEIEACLRTHPQVNQAVVVAFEGQSADKQLVAYVVLRPNQTLTVNQMRTHLQHSLPEFMIPASFVILDKLPLTTSGKVDRRQLPAPNEDRPELEEGFVAARTPLEREIANIWEQVLKVRGVGVHDNFFALGGHSLLATQVISRVNELLQVEMALRDLFEQPTVGGFALATAQRQAFQSENETRQLLGKLSELTEEEAQRLLDSGNFPGI